MKWGRVRPQIEGKRLLAFAMVLLAGVLAASAQNPELQQKVAEVKEAMAANKQALAQYTWQEQVTVSLKGDVKKQEHFQVRLGPDGKPQKQSLDAPQEAAAPSGGRLKQHVVEKKKDEYKDYVDQIKELIQQYVPPEKAMLEQAAQKGNVALGPAGGAPGQYQLVLTNYVKQGDKMTLLFDKQQKALVSVSIASYLSDPKDAVNVSVTFAGIPGGPNHVASESIDGVSKQLTIVIANSLYQHL
jgi:23S rRNA pseudoU1915 N3-methylase RlmH